MKDVPISCSVFKVFLVTFGSFGLIITSSLHKAAVDVSYVCARSKQVVDAQEACGLVLARL